MTAHSRDNKGLRARRFQQVQERGYDGLEIGDAAAADGHGDAGAAREARDRVDLGAHGAGDVGEVAMRADDHQLLLPMIIPTFGKEGSPGIKVGLEGSGYGFGNPVVIPA